jgi:Fe-S-cluster containining protein
MSAKENPSPWYREGLAFTCTRCGHCCTGAPGYVWVSNDEIRRIAEFRRESVREFSSRFVRRVLNRHSLVEKPGGDCIFWDKDAGCTIYPARPVQCQTWPFWPENVESPAAWERVCEVCPGSGHGRVYSMEEILSDVGKVDK